MQRVSSWMDIVHGLSLALSKTEVVNFNQEKINTLLLTCVAEEVVEMKVVVKYPNIQHKLRFI